MSTAEKLLKQLFRFNGAYVGRPSNGSCVVVADVVGDEESIDYSFLFRPSGWDVWWLNDMTEEDRAEFRQTALCFFGAMIDAGDIK